MYKLPDSFFIIVKESLDKINKAITDYSVPNPQKNMVITFFEGKFNLTIDGQALSLPSKYAFNDCEEKISP